MQTTGDCRQFVYDDQAYCFKLAFGVTHYYRKVHVEKMYRKNEHFFVPELPTNSQDDGVQDLQLSKLNISSNSDADCKPDTGKKLVTLNFRKPIDDDAEKEQAERRAKMIAPLLAALKVEKPEVQF